MSCYVVTRSLLSAGVVELIFSHDLTRLKYYANYIVFYVAQILKFRLSERNRFRKL